MMLHAFCETKIDTTFNSPCICHVPTRLDLSVRVERTQLWHERD